MNIDRKWIVRFILAAAGIFLALQYWGGFTSLLGAALSAARPLLLGGAIAYILNLLVGFYERKLLRSKGGKLRRPLCILLAFLTMGLFAGLIFSLVIPELIAGLRLLGVEIEKALIWIQAQVEPNSFFYGMTEYLADSQAELQKTLEHILSAVLSGASGILSLMGSLVSGVVTVAIALIFSIYLLLGKEKLHRQVNSLMKVYLPQRFSEKLVLIARTMDHAFHSFIVGQCTEAVILGLLCTVGMLLLGLPYAPMIGALIGVTALVPVAGAYIGGGIGAFLILTVSPMKALIFLIYLVLLQQVEGNLIYPRVVGSSIGLPGMWVLAAVTIGGGLAGIPGVLLGVPLAAGCYQLVKGDVKKKMAAVTPKPLE